MSAPWYVCVYVRGTYVGAYRHATEADARADAKSHNRLARLGCRYCVTQEAPRDPATVEAIRDLREMTSHVAVPFPANLLRAGERLMERLASPPENPDN